MTDWLTRALAYARDGLPVFPLHGVHQGRCTCGHDPADVKHAHGKHPLIPAEQGGRGHLDATTDEGTIRAWGEIIAEGLPANLGVAIPEGVAVIDVDPRNGGVESLLALEAHFGSLPYDRVTA